MLVDTNGNHYISIGERVVDVVLKAGDLEKDLLKFLVFLLHLH